MGLWLVSREYLVWVHLDHLIQAYNPEFSSLRLCLVRDPKDLENRVLKRSRRLTPSSAGSGDYESSVAVAKYSGAVVSYSSGKRLYAVEFSTPDWVRTNDQADYYKLEFDQNHFYLRAIYRYYPRTICVTWMYDDLTFGQNQTMSGTLHQYQYETSYYAPSPQDFPLGDLKSTSTGSFSGRCDYQTLALPTPSMLNTAYLPDIVGTGLYPELDHYLAGAYVDACESLPALRMNNIANAIEIISTVVGMVTGHLDKVGSLSDAWLGYRYSFSTTTSDIQDVVSYCTRLSALGGIPNVTTRGKVSIPLLDGTHALLRCSVTLSSSGINAAKTWVEQMGLALSAYNAWDMVPYSFIVDWILPIGPMLEAAESADYAFRLSPSEVWYSLQHQYQQDDGINPIMQTDYYRWRAHSVPNVTPSTVLPTWSKNKTTWVKRAADVLAILH